MLSKQDHLIADGSSPHKECMQLALYRMVYMQYTAVLANHRWNEFRWAAYEAYARELDAW
jgi:hypothetical protein